MGKIIVQLYEIQTPSEAERLIMLGVDHIGSVIVSAEAWKIQSIKDTVRVIDDGGVRSSLIPLFSDTDTVLRALDYYQPDIVHFCDALPLQIAEFGVLEGLVSLQESVKKRFPDINVMRSIPIAQTGMSGRVPTIELAGLFETVSDFFLTDTLLLNSDESEVEEQPVKGFVGITGKTCDWGMAAKLVESSRIPVILAGGVSPDNVFEGIRRTRPAGVDSCTATNAADSEGRSIRFTKDFDKVKRFVEEVRRAETAMKKGVLTYV